MEVVSSKKFLQIWLVTLVIASLLAIPQTIQRAADLEIILLRSKWFGLVVLFGLTALLGTGMFRSAWLGRIAGWLDGLEVKLTQFMRVAVGGFLIVFGFLFLWGIRFYVFGSFLPQLMPLFWVFLWAGLFQSFGLRLAGGGRLSWQVSLAFVFLAQGVAYQAVGILSIVSADPFSIGYSEAGRHYYASLFFSETMYGISLPYPFLHPSRYMLLSLPFLFEGLPLWVHRLWQALLWIGLTSASALLLARRMKLRNGALFLAAAWAFLYFLQGAVYYHLQICVILILAGVSVKHPWRSLVFIILASLWAGVSRVNWFPVPATLGITLYLLETSLSGKGWKYWITPFVWGVSGLLTALLAQFAYIQISGNADVSAFGSSFTSDLIWSRLLPNETFALGILPGILLVSAPLFAALYQMTRGRMAALHPLRWLALVSMLLILFVGGAVVSTKIGGGGDLHNMDAYLVALSVLVTAFWAGQVAAENEAQWMRGNVQWGVVFVALLIPLGFALPQFGRSHSYDPVLAQAGIQKLEQVVSETVNGGGEVLFVTERQLLTFGYLSPVPLVAEYEQSELMEMAMSRNRVYLEKFYSDLAAQRFAVIIAEDQKYSPRKSGAFVEEDAAWVRYVGVPILCYYKPAESLASNNLKIFVPRPNPAECKDPFSE
ncbi:MAG: hypothetical protein Q8L87_02860 [Anaerolineales bacterium]|nr:hypothetical protein [Anaerolineales bacterium]